MDDYYFETETTFDDEPHVEPGDERSMAIETARSWELPYLDDEPLLIDSESATRVGGEELARIGAVPVRCGDRNVRVVLADATPERIAGIREHFSGAVDIGVVKSVDARLPARRRVDGRRVPGSDPVANGAAAAAPVWGRSLERVLSASTPRRRGCRTCATSCRSSAARWPRASSACRSSRRSSSGCASSAFATRRPSTACGTTCPTGTTASSAPWRRRRSSRRSSRAVTCSEEAPARTLAAAGIAGAGAAAAAAAFVIVRGLPGLLYAAGICLAAFVGAVAVFAGRNEKESVVAALAEEAPGRPRLRERRAGAASRTIIAELELELAATGSELAEHRHALANLAAQRAREAEAARRNAQQLEPPDQ